MKLIILLALFHIINADTCTDTDPDTYQGIDHCDICDIQACVNRTNTDCHERNPPARRDITSDTCIECTDDKIVLDTNLFECVVPDIDCVCDFDRVMCTDDYQKCENDPQYISSRGNGISCPDDQRCISNLDDYVNVRQKIKDTTKNYKSAKFGSKSLFRTVVQNFHFKTIRLLVRQKVDDRARAAVDLMNDFKTRKYVSSFSSDEDKKDRVKALKLMMPKKFRLKKKKYTVNTGLNKQQKIDAIKTEVANSTGTVEEMIDVKFIKNVEYNDQTYEICEDDVANVIWNGNHNIIEVYSLSDYDDTSITTGDERHGFEQNTEKIVYDLHAPSGQTRYFKCGAHPSAKFKITCSASRRRLLQTEETDDVDVTVHDEECTTECESEICTGYTDPNDGLCYPHTECDSDEYLVSEGTDTTDTTCAACSENNDMWLDTSVDAIGVCTIKPSCSAGEYYTDNGANTAPTCTACNADEYQDQESHKETACISKPSCNAGEYYTDNGQDTASTCTPCGDGTYKQTTDSYNFATSGMPSDMTEEECQAYGESIGEWGGTYSHWDHLPSGCFRNDFNNSGWHNQQVHFNKNQNNVECSSERQCVYKLVGHKETSCEYKNNHYTTLNTPGCDAGKGLYYPDPESKTEDDYECLPCDDPNAGAGSTYNQGVDTSNTYNADSSSTAQCLPHTVFYECVDEDTCTSLACTSGHYLIEGDNQTNAVCQQCAAGSVSMLHAIDLGGCTVCGGDQHPNNANEVEAYANSVCVDDTPCAPGNTYASDNDNKVDNPTCTQCVAGEFLTAAEASSKTGTCTVCSGPGKQTVNENDAFAATGGSKCEECPPGTYDHDGSTSTACLPCDAGKYQDASGQTECKTCEAGTFQHQTGQPSCIALTQCQADQGSTNEAVANKDQSTEDRLCDKCLIDGKSPQHGSYSVSEVLGTVGAVGGADVHQVCIDHFQISVQAKCTLSSKRSTDGQNRDSDAVLSGGVCVDIQECTQHDVEVETSTGTTMMVLSEECNAGICQEMTGNPDYTCSCFDGYSGDNCTIPDENTLDFTFDIDANEFKLSSYDSLLEKRFESKPNPEIQLCANNEYYLYRMEKGNPITIEMEGATNEDYLNDYDENAGAPVIGDDGTPPSTVSIQRLLVNNNDEEIEHCAGEGGPISFDSSIDVDNVCTGKTETACGSPDCKWDNTYNECFLQSHYAEIHNNEAITNGEECYAACQINEDTLFAHRAGPNTVNSILYKDPNNGPIGRRCICQRTTAEVCKVHEYSKNKWGYEVWALQPNAQPVVATQGTDCRNNLNACSGSDYSCVNMDNPMGRSLCTEEDVAALDSCQCDTPTIEYRHIDALDGRNCKGHGPISFDQSIDTENVCSVHNQVQGGAYSSTHETTCESDRYPNNLEDNTNNNIMNSNNNAKKCVWDRIDWKCYVSSRYWRTQVVSLDACFRFCTRLFSSDYQSSDYTIDKEITIMEYDHSEGDTHMCDCQRTSVDVCSDDRPNTEWNVPADNSNWKVYEIAHLNNAVEVTPTEHTSGVGDLSMTEEECKAYANSDACTGCTDGGSPSENSVSYWGYPLGCSKGSDNSVRWSAYDYNHACGSTTHGTTFTCIKKVSTRRRLMSPFTKLRIDTNQYGYKPHNITLAVGTYTYKNDDGFGGTIEVKDCTEVETLEAALSKNSRELVADLSTKSATTLNMLDAKGQTLAHKVAKNLKNVRDFKSTLAVLKKQGADLSKKDRQGKGVIELAARELLANAVGAERESIKAVLKDAVKDVCKFKTVKTAADRPAGKTDEEWEEYECGLLDKSSVYCQVRSNSRRRRLLQGGDMDIYDEETGDCNGYFLNDECTAYSICAEHQYMSVMGDNTTDHTCTDREYCGPGFGVQSDAVDATVPGGSGTPTQCTACVDSYSDSNTYSRLNSGASCSADADCPAHISCVDNVCALRANGNDCISADQCLSAHCGDNYKCTDLDANGCKPLYECQINEEEKVAPTTSSNRECRCDWGYGRKAIDFYSEVGVTDITVHDQPSGTCYNCGTEGLTHGYCACHDNMYSKDGTCHACPDISTNANSPDYPDPLTDGDTSLECVCALNYFSTVVDGNPRCLHCPRYHTNAESTIFIENTCDFNDNICKPNEYAFNGACLACPPGLKNKGGDDPSLGDTECDDPHLCNRNEHVLLVGYSWVCLPCPPGEFTHGGDDPFNHVITDCCPYNTYETVAADAYIDGNGDLQTIDRVCEPCGDNAINAKNKYSDLNCCVNTEDTECVKLKLDLGLHCVKDTC